MTVMSSAARLDRKFLARLADWFVVGTAITLPWSTSAAGICIAAWLITLLPTLDWAAVKREILTPAGGLPVLLWCFGAIGMLWADVDWPARFAGLGGFNRLLAIPLLLAQFRRSEHNDWVVRGFLFSSAAVLAVSYVLILTPGLTWRGSVPGVPVHDDIFQSTEFLICGFGALGYAAREGARRNWPVVSAAVVLAALFLASFGLFMVSRTALVVAPVFAVMLGWWLFRWRGILAACVIAGIVGAGFWAASPNLRTRVYDSFDEMHQYRTANAATSLGMHAAFLKGSMEIIASAPIFGHGTGSIHDQFQRVTANRTGAAAVVTFNPHNQTFAVAIQLGFAGALVLWAMWMAHVRLFCSDGINAWIGILLVVENIVSSIANSHLFDFSHGWLYVFGVGVFGGMVLRERERG